MRGIALCDNSIQTGRAKWMRMGWIGLVLTLSFAADALPGAQSEDDQELIARIYQDYPNLNPDHPDHGQLSDFEKVRMLVDYAYRKSPSANSAGTIVQSRGTEIVHAIGRNEISLLEGLDQLSAGEAAVLCGGTAAIARNVLELFGYDAWYVGSGFYPPTSSGSRFTHATVLVKINHQGRDIFTLHDPSTNTTYADAESGNPIDYFDMLERLAARKSHEISTMAPWTDGINRGRPFLLLTEESTTGKTPQDFEDSWYVDPENYQVEDLGRGVWKLWSHRTVARFERVGDIWFKNELLAEGLPRESIYIHSLVFSISGGPSSEKLLQRARVASRQSD